MKIFADMANASHIIKSIKKENDHYICEVGILDTPEGKMLKDITDNVRIYPVGIGSVKNGVVQDDYKIISFGFEAINNGQ